MFLLDQNSPAQHSWKEDHDMMGRSWETPNARVGELWYKSVSTRKGMWACHAEYWLGNAIILLQMACYHWRTHGRSIDTCAKQDDDYWSSVRPDLKTCFPSKVKLQMQWIRSYFSMDLSTFRKRWSSAYHTMAMALDRPELPDLIGFLQRGRLDMMDEPESVLPTAQVGVSYGLLQVCRCTFPVFLVRKGGG